MRLESISVAAKELNVSRLTLYSWIEQGRVPLYKFGDRVRRIDMDALLADGLAAGTQDVLVGAESGGEEA